MKSAYELAMERLQKQTPSVQLTDDQRREIAEIDSQYRAKIAERELLLEDQIRREQASGNIAEIDQLRKQLSSELRRLSEESEQKKEKIRQARKT